MRDWTRVGLVMWAATALSAVTSCRGGEGRSAPCEITEVVPSFEDTVIYVRVNPASADLPWTVSRTETCLVTRNGERVPLRGLALRGKIARAFPPVTILAAGDRKSLKFEFAPDPSPPVQSATALTREPGACEIALSFHAARQDATTLVIAPAAGKPVTIPVPTQ
jgi:hypothetical protein